MFARRKTVGLSQARLEGCLRLDEAPDAGSIAPLDAVTQGYMRLLYQAAFGIVYVPRPVRRRDLFPRRLERPSSFGAGRDIGLGRTELELRLDRGLLWRGSAASSLSIGKLLVILLVEPLHLGGCILISLARLFVKVMALVGILGHLAGQHLDLMGYGRARLPDLQRMAVEPRLVVARLELVRFVGNLELLAQGGYGLVPRLGGIDGDAEPGVVAHRARRLPLGLHLLAQTLLVLLVARAGHFGALDRLNRCLELVLDRGMLGGRRRLVHLGTRRLLEHRPARLRLGLADRRMQRFRCRCSTWNIP